jgi:cell division protein FtsW
MIPRSARNTSNSIAARKHRPDYGLFVSASILLAVGLIIMYAISPALAAQGGDVSDNYFVIRQSIAIAIGITAFYVFSRIPYTFWKTKSKIIIIAAFVLTILAILIGGDASRWIQFGTFSIQTVEFVKLALIVVLASYLAILADQGNLTNWRAWKTPGILFGLMIFLVIFVQDDLGSAAVILAIALGMMFMAGFPIKYFVIAILAMVVLAGVAVISTPYRLDRVNTFLSPSSDCQNEGYHACQALIAVGSGGVLGVGLGRSVQAYGYLPEAENDSIFAIYAEKFGFVGSIALLSVFAALLIRILRIMQRAPNRYAQLIVAGVFTWLLVQATVNIAAMLSLIPLKGITLPFISYGGTSLIFTMAALGLVFQISRYTSLRRINYTYEPSKGDSNENMYHWRRDGRPRYTVTRRSV